MNDTRIFVSWDTAHPPTGPAILAVGPGFEYCFHFPGKSALEARAILDRALALVDAAEREAQARKRFAADTLMLLEIGYDDYKQDNPRFPSPESFLHGLLYPSIPHLARHAVVAAGLQLSRAISAGVAPSPFPVEAYLHRAAQEQLGAWRLFSKWSKPFQVAVPADSPVPVSRFAFSTEADFLGFHDAIVAFADADRTGA